MFKRKESMSIKEFMNRKEKESMFPLVHQDAVDKGMIAGFSLGMVPLIFPMTKAVPASAHEVVTVTAQSQMYDKMITAFDPLINLIQGLAYPIAMIVVLGGSILVMMQQREKGYSMIMGAGLGYVLVQMTPMVLDILVDAMKVV
ncbi:hypothetical protein ACFYKX_26635 [Cytobacillus sp. FJAT-54145]|uniref:TrbC/VirB2 family protein n=1 Tax=Cytobacillus spartinae TaxID=3299023 RepID=A0ABW6KIX7_9BACI